MTQYVLRRLLAAIPVLFLTATFTFLAIRLIPGDVVMTQLQGTGRLSDESIQQIRAELGLDRSVAEQYVSWFGGVIRGDLGNSLLTRNPTIWQIRDALPTTLEIAFLSLLLSVAIAVPAGVISAVRQETAIDYAVRLISTLLLSIPDFVIGTVLILYLAIWFSYQPPLNYTELWRDPWNNLQQIYIPVILLGVRLSAITMRMTRSAMLEVLRQDYIRTASAKGLRERTVMVRHALKNALIPVITIVGNQFGFLLGGTVIVETLFLLPGMGRLTLDSILLRDYTQLQANVLLLTGIFILVNLIVDISYGWFDPRIRY